MIRLPKMAIVSGMTRVTTTAALMPLPTALERAASCPNRSVLNVMASIESANPAAPAFEDIAHVPGMMATALTVALQTLEARRNSRRRCRRIQSGLWPLNMVEGSYPPEQASLKIICRGA